MRTSTRPGKDNIFVPVYCFHSFDQYPYSSIYHLIASIYQNPAGTFSGPSSKSFDCLGKWGEVEPLWFGGGRVDAFAPDEDVYWVST